MGGAIRRRGMTAWQTRLPLPLPPRIPLPRPAPRGLFVAVGHDGQRLVSVNGTDWDHQQFGKEGEVYRAVCFGNGRYVAVGSYGGRNIYASTRDGVTWQTGYKDAQYRTYVRGLGFGRGEFLGIGGDPGSVGNAGPLIVTSADGIQWSDYLPIAGKNILRRIAWGNAAGKEGDKDEGKEGGLWVGVGDRGRRAASPDGRHWTDAPGVKAIDTLIDVAFGPVKHAGHRWRRDFRRRRPQRLAHDQSGRLQWANRQVGEEGEHLNSVLWAGGRFVAVGQGATYFSPDGVNWTRKQNKDAHAYGRPRRGRR